MVRWARKRAGMTQHQLARAVHMPQPSIARIERGTVTPRADTLVAILVATGHELAVEPTGPTLEAADRRTIRRTTALPVPMRTWRAVGRAAKDPRTSPFRLLKRLRVAGVPFVLVGDLAEAAHGSPAKVGPAIEVCHAQTEVARARLATALADIEAIGSDASRLRLLVRTDAGDDYDALVRTAVRMHVDAGIVVHVAALDDLIRIRRARGTAADRSAAAVLRAIGDEAPPAVIGPDR